MAMALLARTLTTKPAPFSSLLTRSFSVASRPSLSSSASALKSFRPLAALAELGRRSQTDVVVRSFSSRPTTSSLNDPSPNWNNRPPKETILLDGCDFEHWLVVVEPPQPETLRDDIIDSYIKTLAQVVGSEEEARHKIYSVSTKHYFAFGALVSEELSYKLKELPGVRWVLPDSYLDVKNKDYGGEPFIDGQAVPYDPKYHEEWVRNNARANERSRRNDRPRNNDRSRNFERRRENMQNRDVQMPNRGMPNAAPNMGSGPPNAGPPNMAPNAGGMPPRGNFQNMPPNQNVPSNPGMSPNGNFQNMPPNPNVAPNAPYRGGFPPNGNMQQNPSMQYNAPNRGGVEPNPNMQYNAPNANMQYNAPGPNAGYSNNMPTPSMQYNAHGPNTGGGIPPYQNQGGYQNGGYQNNYAPSANVGGPPGGNNNYQVNDVPGRD